jgi:N-acetylglucosaminyl-diphospho-decaprenol L-rhamnosyltransferase
LQLSIIIVNYNVQYFLEQCLYSVIKGCTDIDAEIFVVDNNSTDDSKIFFSDKFSSVKFIWNTENIGFAKANNQALQLSSGKYILFLNPDTIVPEDCFSKCINFLDSNLQIGGLGIKMIDGTGNFLKESKRGFPTPFTSLYKLCGLAKAFPTSPLFAQYYLGHLNENKNHEVDVLAGAFMMVPKKVLDTVGSFDETFFMYGEDIDLSYRIQKAGFKNYYFADGPIVHFKGESTNKSSVEYLRHFYRAMHLFSKKHYDFTRSSIVYFLITILIAVNTIKTIVIKIIAAIFSIFGIIKIREPKKRLIVANENEYHKIIDLLRKAGAKLNVSARIELHNSGNTTALGSLNMLPSLISKYSIEEIIFCEDELSFKEIITSMEQNSFLDVDYMLQASGSSSIIGSNDKTSGGTFIVAKKK